MKPTLKNAASVTFLLILVFFFVMPLYFTIINSLKPLKEIVTSYTSVPKTLYLGNYAKAWIKTDYPRVFLNSLIITASSLVGIIVTSSEESSVIDGCSRHQTFFKIVFPLLTPVTSTIAVLDALWIWNDFVLALVFLPFESQRTMPVGLMMLFKAKKALADWSAVMAAVVIMMLPMIIIFLLLQKQVIKGATAGSLKG